MKKYIIASLASILISLGIGYLVSWSPLNGAYYGGWIVGGTQQLVYWVVLYTYKFRDDKGSI